MCVEVVTAICLINGDIEVRQIECYGWLRIPCGYADTLHTFSHYGTLGLIQENGSNYGDRHKGQELLYLIYLLIIYSQLFNVIQSSKYFWSKFFFLQAQKFEQLSVYSHSTVMFRELLARPCSFSARQRYVPSACGLISVSSSMDSSPAFMVPTSSPSFSQVIVGTGFP